jgi:hypothetical protein
MAEHGAPRQRWNRPRPEGSGGAARRSDTDSVIDGTASEAIADDGLEVRLVWPSRPSEAVPSGLDHRPAPRVEADAAPDPPPARSAPLVTAFAGGGVPSDDGIDLVPVLPLLPALAGRIDTIDGQLRALAVRLDVLTSSVSAIRGAITDRIDSYVSTVADIDRNSTQALGEHRRTVERAVAETRRTVTATEGIVQRIGTRLDDVGADVSAVLEATRQAGSSARTADALGRLESGLAALEARVAAALPSESEENATVLAALARLEERMTALDEGVAVRLAESAGVAAVTMEGLASIREVVARLAAVRAAEPTGRQTRDPEALAAVERAVAQVLTLVEVIVDTMPASADGSADDIAERVAEAVLERLDRADGTG